MIALRAVVSAFDATEDILKGWVILNYNRGTLLLRVVYHEIHLGVTMRDLNKLRNPYLQFHQRTSLRPQKCLQRVIHLEYKL